MTENFDGKEESLVSAAPFSNATAAGLPSTTPIEAPRSNSQGNPRYAFSKNRVLI
jgi:hypothetical protein